MQLVTAGRCTSNTLSNGIKQTVAKAKKKINLLKSLAGSSLGCAKETILLTYKSIIRSVLEYASPVWSPVIKDTHWKRLQSIQSQALRIASGCLSMSAIEHLHTECMVMPLREHCVMTGKQYVAACHMPDNPGHRLLQAPTKPAQDYEKDHNLPTWQGGRKGVRQKTPLQG